MQQRQPGSDELRQWERDWRASTTAQVQETARALSDVAGIVREMRADVKDLMQWRSELERRKEDRIEKAPDTRRADLALVLSCVSALIYLATLIAAHWR